TTSKRDCSSDVCSFDLSLIRLRAKVRRLIMEVLFGLNPRVKLFSEQTILDNRDLCSQCSIRFNSSSVQGLLRLLVAPRTSFTLGGCTGEASCPQALLRYVSIEAISLSEY